MPGCRLQRAHSAARWRRRHLPPIGRAVDLQLQAQPARPQPLERLHQLAQSARLGHRPHEGRHRHLARRAAAPGKRRDRRRRRPARHSARRDRRPAPAARPGPPRAPPAGTHRACAGASASRRTATCGRATPAARLRLQRRQIRQVHQLADRAHELERQTGQRRRLQADDVHHVGALGLEDAGQLPGLRPLGQRVAPGGCAVEIDEARVGRIEAASPVGAAAGDHDAPAPISRSASSSTRQWATVSRSVAGQDQHLAAPGRTSGRAARPVRVPCRRWTVSTPECARQRARAQHPQTRSSRQAHRPARHEEPACMRAAPDRASETGLAARDP